MGNSPSKGDDTNAKPGTGPTNISKAIKEGNQLYIDKDVREKLSTVAQIMDSYKKEDSKALLRDVETINAKLKAQGLDLNISGPIERALLEHHRAIIASIDDSVKLKDPKDRNAAINAIMNNPEAFKKHLEPMKEIKTEQLFEYLGQHYNKDFDKKIGSILEEPHIRNNEGMKSNITSVADSIKALRIKYKFFEYKYVQLNIFMILLIQHVFNTMDEFIENVLLYNKQRDIMREEMVKNTFTAIKEMMQSADLTMNMDEFSKMEGLLTNLSNSVVDKEKRLEKHMEELKQISNASLKDFIDSLSQATRDEATRILGEPPKPAESPNAYGMRGGFPRDGVHFPQKFYELDSQCVDGADS